MQTLITVMIQVIKQASKNKITCYYANDMIPKFCCLLSIYRNGSSFLTATVKIPSGTLLPKSTPRNVLFVDKHFYSDKSSYSNNYIHDILLTMNLTIQSK